MKKKESPTQCSECGSKHIHYNATLSEDFNRGEMTLDVTSEWLCSECDETFEFWQQYKVGDLLDSD